MILTQSKPNRKPKQLDLVAHDSTSNRVWCANGDLVAKLAECRAQGFDVLSMIVDRPSGYWLVVRKASK